MNRSEHFKATASHTASQNQWYVLATIYGEHKGLKIDDELHQRNRHIWNSWVWKCLSNTDRAFFRENDDLDLGDLDPWTSEESAYVKEQLKARTGGNGTIPDPTAMCDLKNLVFDKTVCFDGFIFPGGADFCDSNFDKIATFYQATFIGDAGFFDVKFHSESDFRNAHFDMDGEFENAKFGGIANFEGAVFNLSASLTSCTFSDDALFGNIDFKGEARFDGVTFAGNASWAFSTFAEDVTFCWSVFDRHVSFTRTEFQEFSDFANAQFLHTTTFHYSRFTRTMPTLSGALLHPNTIFTADKNLWPKILADDINELQDSQLSLAMIRQAIAIQGRPEEEHFFFRREMECRSLSGSIFHRLPYRLFGTLSEFGYSIKRPLVGLLGLWLVFGVAYGFLVYGAFDSWSISALSKIASGLGLSVANILIFLGFHGRFEVSVFEGASAWLIFFSGIQTVIGFIYLFFLGLGLRTRFRIR